MSSRSDYISGTPWDRWVDTGNWPAAETHLPDAIGCQAPPSTDEIASRVHFLRHEVAAETKMLAASDPGPRDGEWVLARSAQLEEARAELTVWEQLRAQRVAAGEMTQVTRHDVAVGDEVLVDGAWRVVARVNSRTVWVCPLDGPPWRPVGGVVTGSELVGLERVQEQRSGSRGTW